jgi:hypothetical protein
MQTGTDLPARTMQIGTGLPARTIGEFRLTGLPETRARYSSPAAAREGGRCLCLADSGTMIQRDYIERLIEQCAEALRRAARLRGARELDPALRTVREAADQVLGPLRPLLERMEASSAVAVVGRAQVDRVRLYAALLGEEALIQAALGDSASAYLCGRRALELFAAVSLAGAALDAVDRDRIGVLATRVDVRELDVDYQAELRQLADRGGPTA